MQRERQKHATHHCADVGAGDSLGEQNEGTKGKQ